MSNYQIYHSDPEVTRNALLRGLFIFVFAMSIVGGSFYTRLTNPDLQLDIKELTTALISIFSFFAFLMIASLIWEFGTASKRTLMVGDKDLKYIKRGLFKETEETLKYEDITRIVVGRIDIRFMSGESSCVYCNYFLNTNMIAGYIGNLSGKPIVKKKKVIKENIRKLME